MTLIFVKNNKVWLFLKKKRPTAYWMGDSSCFRWIFNSFWSQEMFVVYFSEYMWLRTREQKEISSQKVQRQVKFFFKKSDLSVQVVDNQTEHWMKFWSFEFSYCLCQLPRPRDRVNAVSQSNFMFGII